jgi:hypothetical protein
LEAAFEESALEGMVPWEAGNARYLMKAVGAKASHFHGATIHDWEW